MKIAPILRRPANPFVQNPAGVASWRLPVWQALAPIALATSLGRRTDLLPATAEQAIRAKGRMDSVPAALQPRPQSNRNGTRKTQSPSASQSDQDHRRPLASNRPNLRFVRARRMQKLFRRRRIWIYLSVRGSIPDSHHVRCDGRLSGGVLCLAWPARKSAQGGHSCLADRDSAGPYRASRPVRCALDPLNRMNQLGRAIFTRIA